MSKTQNALNHLMVLALSITALVIVTGAITTATTALTVLEYASIAWYFVTATAIVGLGWSLNFLVEHQVAYWSAVTIDQRLSDLGESWCNWAQAEAERRSMGESLLAFYGVYGLVSRFRFQVWLSLNERAFEAAKVVYRAQNR